MDKATLVRSDVEIEGRVLNALNRARIPLTLCDWRYAPQLDEWHLVIATPWYDSKGPRGAYSRVVDALQAAGIYKDVPMRRLYVRSPDDPIVKSLEREVRVRQEGDIQILEGTGGKYLIMYLPFSGSGGAVPTVRLSGLDEVRQFLEKRLRRTPSEVDAIFAELQRKGTAVFPIGLTNKEAKRLGLA